MATNQGPKNPIKLEIKNGTVVVGPKNKLELDASGKTEKVVTETEVKNNVPLQPTINNKTSSQTLAEEILGGTFKQRFQQQIKDAKPVSNLSSKKSNWEANGFKTAVEGLQNQQIKLNKDPDLETQIWKSNMAAKQAVNAELDSYIVEFDKNVGLRNGLKTFKDDSWNYAKSSKNYYNAYNQFNNAKELVTKNKSNANINAYNVAVNALNKEAGVYEKSYNAYNDSKSKLVDIANKSDGKLFFTNNKFYNKKDHLRNSEDPSLTNVNSKFSTDYQTTEIDGSLNDYYANTNTGPGYTQIQSLKKQGEKQINDIVNPVLKSFYEKSFQNFDVKNIKKTPDNINTMYMFSNAVRYVTYFGTTSDSETESKEMQQARMILKYYNAAKTPEQQALVLNEYKDEVLGFVDKLGPESKKSLFEQAYEYKGKKVENYPGKSDPKDKKNNIYWHDLTQSVFIKISDQKEFVTFEKDLQNLAIEKLRTSYQDLQFLGSKNKSPQDYIKYITDKDFIDPKTGAFQNRETWKKNNQKILFDMFRRQQGTEVRRAGNEILDAMDYFGYRLARPSTWLSGMGDFDTDFEYIAAGRGGENVMAYDDSKANDIYDDLVTQYKKVYDKLDMSNLAKYKKSVINHIGNIRNIPLDYTGLDLSMTESKSILKANDEAAPSAKHDNANKIINLLKLNNNNWITDEVGQDIEVLSKADLEAMGEYNITQPKLDKFKNTSKNLDLFFSSDNDNVTMRFYRNTSVKDKARYDFIQDEGGKNEKQISVFIPYDKLDEDQVGEKGAESLFNRTKFTQEEFIFKLNGLEKQFPVYTDKSTDTDLYESAKMTQTQIGDDVIYKCEIKLKDQNGNNSTIIVPIENAGVISYLDAAQWFNTLLQQSNKQDLLDEVAAQKLKYKNNN
jgi:hypothetical protein